ncbi:Transcriptional regulator, MerR family [gamma proteobacterium HdN1]|nr:Transcriptional regulator, MerR family [gamma proteobacterium HdN1]
MNKRTYTISELAQEFGITTRTIRFYEDEGLLAPLRDGQRRIYSPRDRTLLKLILRGKRLGFSLAESRILFDMYDPANGSRQQLESYLQMLDEKNNSLEQQLRDIKSMQQDLEDARVRCLDALKNTFSPNPCGDSA